MAFYFKNTYKDIIPPEEDEKRFRDNSICPFFEKQVFVDKARDHCHLICKNRRLAYSKCNGNVTQRQSNFKPFAFHNISTCECHLLFRRLVDTKKDKVKYGNIPKTKEGNLSLTYDCIKINDS